MDDVERNLALDRLMEPVEPTVYGPPSPMDETDIPQRAIDAETIERLNVRINELTDIIDERDNQLALNANRFEQIESNHQVAVRSARAETVKGLNDWFVERILSFDQGCAPGKRSFIKFCELEVPTEVHTFTMQMRVPIATDIYDARCYLNAAVNEYLSEQQAHDALEDWSVQAGFIHSPDCECDE
jgi:uncharacterized coiled-coil protein SlyX